MGVAPEWRELSRSDPTAGTDGLRRALSTWDLTWLVFGNVIGSGIFIVPSVVLRQSGSVSVALSVWVIGGVLSLFGALAYAELGAMDAGAGGLYAFVRDAFGQFAAFLVGWTMFFGIGGGTIAALSVAATNYLGEFAILGDVVAKVIAVVLIAIIGAITISGIRRSATVQNWGALVKLGAVVVMSVMLIAAGDGGPPLSEPSTDVSTVALLSAAGTAMISVLWAYEGWQYVTFSAGEAKDPRRSLPLAIGLGVAGIAAVYLLANFAYLSAIGAAGVAATDRVAADAMTSVFGAWAGKVIAAVIILSMVSAALSVAITMPRGYFSMARDGVFFPSFARVHPKFGTPAAAIAGLCAWAAVLTLSGTFEELLAYVIFVGWIFYALAAAAVIVLRKKRPHAERPYRVPGYPMTPILFVLAAALLVINTIAAQPRVAGIGLLMVFAGAPAYWYWRRKTTVTP
ncbi:MAG TPA: amino acid permease [Gemmatimonadaceae bacterium]